VLEASAPAGTWRVGPPARDTVPPDAPTVPLALPPPAPLLPLEPHPIPMAIHAPSRRTSGRDTSLDLNVMVYLPV
jgi:hypothetical protein